jgi:hypothetical protein
MGVARSPETAANPFRIISETLPAQMRAGPLPKSYATRRAAPVAVGPHVSAILGTAVREAAGSNSRRARLTPSNRNSKVTA